MRLSENGPTYTVTISAKELAVMSAGKYQPRPDLSRLCSNGPPN